MKNVFFVILTIIAGVIIITSFFMPWVRASTSVTKVSRTITNTVSPLEGLPFVRKLITGIDEAAGVVGSVGDIDINKVVSGYDIPATVNDKSSKIALSFVQSYFGDVKDLDKKSMLVFLMPLFAIVCIMLAISGIWYKISIIIMLILSGSISLGGIYTLKTMDLSNAMVQISIENGLWRTMHAYLFIFVLSIAWFMFGIKGKLKGGHK